MIAEVVRDYSNEYAEDYLELLQPIDMFWSQYPDSLGNDIRRDLAAKIAPLIPGEDSMGGIVGDDQLLVGAHLAFNVPRTDEPLDFNPNVDVGIEAVYQAYHAVLAVELLRAEEEFGISEEEVEERSSICAAEMDFQFRLLDLMESITGTPPTYQELLKQLESTEG